MQKIKNISNQPLKWHGGKSYLATWLHSHAPPSIIEDRLSGYSHRNHPCAGAIGELWNWQPTEGISEAVNDKNGLLTNFWEVLASQELFPEFHRVVGRIPLSENVWETSKLWVTQHGVEDKVSAAAHFFILYRQSRQGLARDYTTPTKRLRRGMNEQASAWLSAVEGLPQIHERLRRVEILNLDCCEFIRWFDHTKALFYIDPPYLPETRSSIGEYGKYEMTRDQHIQLLEQLSVIKGRFMLSGYDSELYARYEAACGWTRHEKIIDNKASSKKVKDQRVECIWTNYKK